eukprot:GHVS01065547.1.p1 GENE.GHVS01065547.1~~GHVS01065547.1.p1  ORF type:complete len:404 (+),score=159.55 GHVS01065547.1:632-1843(+)
MATTTSEAIPCSLPSLFASIAPPPPPSLTNACHASAASYSSRHLHRHPSLTPVRPSALPPPPPPPPLASPLSAPAPCHPSSLLVSSYQGLSSSSSSRASSPSRFPSVAALSSSHHLLLSSVESSSSSPPTYSPPPPPPSFSSTSSSLFANLISSSDPLAGGLFKDFACSLATTDTTSAAASATTTSGGGGLVLKGPSSSSSSSTTLLEDNSSYAADKQQTLLLAPSILLSSSGRATEVVSSSAVPSSSSSLTTSELCGVESIVGRFHCDICSCDLSLTARVHCFECVDFDLCVHCFCKGAEKPHAAGSRLAGGGANVDGVVWWHRNNHQYVVVGRNVEPLLSPDWTADEELMLVDGVSKYGFGNWNEVADLVNQVALKPKKITSVKSITTKAILLRPHVLYPT